MTELVGLDGQPMQFGNVQDELDGAALERLREALPEPPDDKLRFHIDIHHGDVVTVLVGVEGAMHGFNPWSGQDTRPDGCWHDTDGAEVASGSGATIAEAADACRRALDPPCLCGLDVSPDGFRGDVVCPKHDGPVR